MVDICRAPSLGQNVVVSGDAMDLGSRFAELSLAPIYESKVFESAGDGEEVMQHSKKDSYRQPRRAFSSNEYHLPGQASTILEDQAAPANRLEMDGHSYLHPQLSTQPSPGPPCGMRASEMPQPLATTQTARTRQQPRPALPAPQRSYSLIDYEPIPSHLLPGGKLQLPYLPPEIHYAVFDFLDPIDSTCLGLTSRHFYAIHRKMQGTVPLATRREGPNDMEWAWRPNSQLVAAGDSKEKALAMLLPRGQIYCRKCGISRCELHKHIEGFFGDGQEYCEVSRKFGPAPPAGALKSCSRRSPKHPHRCGRHTRQQRAVRLV